MTRIWDFHGGVHPPENKEQSLQLPLAQPPLPQCLILPLSQHIGAPAEPVVKPGDRVLKGQVIAEPVSHVSAYLHAPTSGTVAAIDNYPIPHPSGMSGPCIVIESDGDDEWIEHSGLPDFRALEKHQLADLIRRAGIAGMGGAGFPTDVKLHLADDHIVNTLIINAVECEPYITADDMLMRTRAEEVIGGVEIAAHLVQPTHCLIGVEDNKPEAVRALNAAVRASSLKNIDIVVLPTKYPSGGEKQLIKRLTGIEVPSGKLPADVGIVCQNVGTAAAVYRAVHHGEPLISRITTLTGDALEAPRNLEVLIGTPINELLEFCQVQRPRLARLIMGGPMMGYALAQDAVPVVKTSNCVIAGTEEEFPPPPPAQACIRCGSCEQACPAELLPQQLYWFARGKELDKARRHNLFDCIECGACSFVCPSNIPLVQYYRFAKAEIRREQQEQQKAEQARARFEARQARLEQEKLEKEQRRKARANAAAQAQAQAATGSAAAKAPVENDSPGAVEERLKQLKTQAAVARTKLKKAQKALAEAEANGSGDLEQLRAEIQAQEARAQEVQQAVIATEKAQSAATAASGPDLKALKTAAAVARTKVKKTEKALADAVEKNLPGTAQLQTSLGELLAKAEEAERALLEAEASSASQAAAGPVVDTKALKTAAAVARTKLKKAEKALAEAQVQGSSDLAALEQALQLSREKAEQAQRALDAVEQGSPASPVASAPSATVDLKALKTAAAVARTKVKKTEKALAEAEAKAPGSAESLRKALPDLRAKAEQAQQALAAAEAADTATTER